MKIFGSFSELVATIFRKNSQSVTLRPHDATGATTDIQLPQKDGNEVLVGRLSADQGANRLKNKDIDSATTFFVNADAADKKLQLDPTTSGGTGTTVLRSTQTGTRVLTLPDTTDTLVARATSDTLTNKTINAALNTISNITNTEVSASAAIARTKLASGTASHVIINDGSGVLSSEALLDKTRGGTGVSSTATFPASGVIVTETATETLSNKTLDNTSTINIKDTLFTLQDDGDTTKRIQFNVSNIGTGITRTLNFPEPGASDTLLTQTSSHLNASRLTNKYLDDATTAFVDDSDTTRSFRLSVNASQTTGTQNNFTLPAAGTNLVGESTSQTLTNKTLTSPDINTAIRILNQGQLQLREATGGGTNQVNIQAPAALGADYTLTLPIDDGTASQVLQTDGAGVLSWATVASATPANAGNVYSDGATLLSTPDLRTADLTTINVSVASGITHQHPNLTIDTTSTYTITGKLIAQNTLVVSGSLIVTGVVTVDPIIPQNASASNAGLVSTGAQTFAGNKSFLQGIMTSDVAGEDVTVPLAYTLSHNYLTVGSGRTYSVAGQLVCIPIINVIGTGILSATGSGIINVLG